MWLGITKRASGAALLALLLPAVSTGLESDREQPIHIEANSVVLDERQGVSRYTGDVRLTQGSLRITGDEMIVHRDGRALKQVVVHGAPARFRQRLENEPEPVNARAAEMVYRSEAAQVTLRGAARVEQAGNVFTGEHIVYDTARQSVRAARGESERVHVILQPDRKPAP